MAIAAPAATAVIRAGVPPAGLVADLTEQPLDIFDRDGDNFVVRALQADYDGLDPLGQELFRLLGVQPVNRFPFPIPAALIAPPQNRPTPLDAVAARDETGVDPAGGSRSRHTGRVRRVLDDLVTADLLVHHPADNEPSAEVTDPTGVTGPIWTIGAAQQRLARDLAEALDPSDVRVAALVRVVDVVLWPALHAADSVVTPYRRRTPYPTPPDGPAGSGGLGVFVDRRDALTWLERHVDTVAAYVRALYAAAEYERVWHLVDALWALWLHRKHYTLRLELDALALRAAQALGDESKQAEMFKRIGLAQNSLGAYDEAKEALMAGLALRLKLRDRWGEADCRSALGLHYQAVGDVETGSVQFRLAAQSYRQLGAYRETALTHHNLGVLQLDAGRVGLAQVMLSRTVGEFAALAEPDEYNALRVRIDLARVHLAAKHFRAARDHAVEALDGLRRLGNPAEQARALEVLADIAHATADLSYLPRLADALTLYESVDSPHADRIRERLAADRPATETEAQKSLGENGGQRP
ncbi:hypothetical protein ADK67_27860 [Saccharothrix sp. NRRL B-16348]|uniref:tetratricopeptide repeat protein n=1 Tax=Saccharothrix sp. NRRL B-16348 TaxID=1415542 RepID=UPI0006AF5036|nr:tetratricopeptide repeat protein [Saccharothrix sp. NRRL B-16348]KOX21259.1 hypothetical protein ADK67_27860 [Saccharothrix sp. NRRL B-16348]